MKKLPVILLILFAAFGCKKPFSPVLVSSDNSHYLVIEGVIDGADSTFVRLSRTKKVDTLRTIIAEAGAIVTIESDASISIPLTEIKTGTYATPAFQLDAAHKYRLRIKTTDGKEYASDFIPVKNSPPIDSVGFNAQSSGATVYVNSHDASNLTRYYRWEFEEAWQFNSMYISQYLNGAPRPVDQQVHTCFTGDTSSNIILGTTTKLTNDVVYQSPVTTVAANSEKIEAKYSILVKQYALSPDAYSFWQNLQNNTERLGSIFGVLPSEAPTNFHCISNPSELVVGYLSVGNVAKKRVFITSDQLLSSYKPLYPAACELDTAFNTPQSPAEVISTNIFYEHPALYTTVEGLHIPPYNPFGGPSAYTYSTNICADCTVRGKPNPPPFWR